jgi:hypothetical protein
MHGFINILVKSGIIRGEVLGQDCRLSKVRKPLKYSNPVGKFRIFPAQTFWPPFGMSGYIDHSPKLTADKAIRGGNLMAR